MSSRKKSLIKKIVKKNIDGRFSSEVLSNTLLDQELARVNLKVS
ncbi:13896_t:CDS:2 [Cetraspora pellucida]|uniref:13896_t:CDS:1 n=1 Tax=Cetraspora pellucida TaxID=1433469 RepID=A0A9N9B371_9GLOM|nr:13896_t:CDS:2 [Cetraspora pellucida]